MDKVKNVLLLLGAGLCIAAVGFVIYILIKYGNMPISEIPTWAWWFLKR